MDVSSTGSRADQPAGTVVAGRAAAAGARRAGPGRRRWPPRPRPGRPPASPWRRGASASATVPVQPVWWLAPSPAPLSPWKYSWKSRQSRQCGSSWNFRVPPKTGRSPPHRAGRCRRAAGDLPRHLEQGHHPTRAGRAFHAEVVAMEGVVDQQGAHQHDVDRHPDRAAPVRIAAEHPGIGFRRKVPHAGIPGRRRAAHRAPPHAGARASGCRAGRGTPPRPASPPGCGGAGPHRRSTAGAARYARPGPADGRMPQLGSLLQQPAHPPATSGSSLPKLGSNTAAAQSGSRPTTERTFSRSALPSGRRSTS